MSALSATLLTALCVATLLAPRRWALVAVAAGALFLTQGHILVVAGYNFHVPRILAYVAFIRVISRSEFSIRSINRVDWMLVILYLYTTLVLIFRPEESIPLRLAKMLDILCGYFAFRGLIQETEDLRWFLKIFALMLVPFVGLLAIESITGRNPFAIVGGNTNIWMREGSVRCFGSFRHPSLLGSVGATFFPLFMGMTFLKETRKYAALGGALCVLVVYFSSSGGPLSAWATGVVGWALWPIRTKMRQFRWSLLILVGLLAVVMNAPIWYLLAKVSSVTGGTGWHRSYLIEQSIRHLDKWWAAGIPITETHGWFPYTLASTGGADVTNQFISFGLQAGILAIILLLILLIRMYSHLGIALQFVRTSSEDSQKEEYLLWGLGVMLAVHISNWLGITYWDQFWLIWLLHAAAIAGLSSRCAGSNISSLPPASSEDVLGEQLRISR